MEQEKKENEKTKRDVLRWVIIGLAGFIVVVLIFGVGVKVGGMKARFSYRWGENYHRNFAGPPGGFFGNFMMNDREFTDAHGVFGQIIKIDGSTLVVKGQDDVEKLIVVKGDTVINRFRDTVKVGDLKVDEYVVVIGSPNDSGQIEAKLIRVMPASPELQRGGPPMPPAPSKR